VKKIILILLALLIVPMTCSADYQLVYDGTNESHYVDFSQIVFTGKYKIFIKTVTDDPSENYIVYVPMKVIYHDTKYDSSKDFSVKTMFQSGKTAYYSMFNMAFNLNDNTVLPGSIADFGRNGKFISISDLSSETVAESSTAVVSQSSKSAGDNGKPVNQTNVAATEGGAIKEYRPPIWQNVDDNIVLSSWYNAVTNYVANNRNEVFNRSFAGANIVWLSTADSSIVHPIVIHDIKPILTPPIQWKVYQTITLTRNQPIKITIPADKWQLIAEDDTMSYYIEGKSYFNQTGMFDGNVMAGCGAGEYTITPYAPGEIKIMIEK